MATSLSVAGSVSQREVIAPGIAPAPLDSWKEIASFFARDIRTVQRWERTENLPVYRHLHMKSGTVYAFETELLAWRDARSKYQDPRLLHQRTAGRRLRLAVLPFANLSANPQLRHFEDGLTNELILQLACLDPARLGVIARTSVTSCMQSGSSIAQIGRRLKAHYILEGGVLRAGRQMRIAAQLIDVSDQTHLLADTFKCKWPREELIQIAFAKRIARLVYEYLLPRD